MLRSFVLALSLLTPLAAQDLSDLARLRDYTTHRISSTDPTGANGDGSHTNPIKAGETRTLAEIQGPGIIKDWWMTIATREPYHLKKCVLRIYWDGADEPAVEVPAGDFFGLGLGQYYLWESGPLSVGSEGAELQFPDAVPPFGEDHLHQRGRRRAWRSLLQHRLGEARQPARRPRLLPRRYRQATPTKGVTDDWELNQDVNSLVNLDGKDNYVFFETQGAATASA
ncbi:MAG: DUF2961 domain-containing protein [Bryobacterales bacterium]